MVACLPVCLCVCLSVCVCVCVCVLRLESEFFAFHSVTCSIMCVLKSPEEKVIAVGLSDGRTVIHNIEFDETLMTFRQDWGPVTAISFRTGQITSLSLSSSFSSLSSWHGASDLYRWSCLIKDLFTPQYIAL